MAKQWLNDGVLECFNADEVVVIPSDSESIQSPVVPIGDYYVDGKFVKAEYLAELDNESVVVDIIKRPVVENPVEYGDTVSTKSTKRVSVNGSRQDLIGTTYKDGKFIIPTTYEELTESRIAQKTAAIVLDSLVKK